ncbi:hypothetical protein Hdeb2414_s0006g00219821 [Helianthus debilis subsp. tardiflorus]
MLDLLNTRFLNVEHKVDFLCIIFFFGAVFDSKLLQFLCNGH